MQKQTTNNKQQTRKIKMRKIYRISNYREQQMQTLETITLYDLMADDLDAWICKDKNGFYNLDIDDEQGHAVIREEGLHPYAAEAFADFCKRYLASYNKANKTSQQEAA